jgi:sec-independent protein translocase protein TatB
MEILGIGPSELVFIILIAIIILGPRDMQKAGRTIGRWLNKLIHSEGWQIFQKTSTEMRNLPTRLMREANLEMQEAERDIRKAMDVRQKPGASLSSRSLTPSNEAEHTIQPPAVNQSSEPDTDPDHHD